MGSAGRPHRSPAACWLGASVVLLLLAGPALRSVSALRIVDKGAAREAQRVNSDEGETIANVRHHGPFGSAGLNLLQQMQREATHRTKGIDYKIFSPFIDLWNGFWESDEVASYLKTDADSPDSIPSKDSSLGGLTPAGGRSALGARTREDPSGPGKTQAESGDRDDAVAPVVAKVFDHPEPAPAEEEKPKKKSLLDDDDDDDDDLPKRKKKPARKKDTCGPKCPWVSDHPEKMDALLEWGSKLEADPEMENLSDDVKTKAANFCRACQRLDDVECGMYKCYCEHDECNEMGDILLKMVSLCYRVANLDVFDLVADLAEAKRDKTCADLKEE